MEFSETKLGEIERLLQDTDLPIAVIAAKLGISRQALYERLRLAGIEIGKRQRANAYTPLFHRRVLMKHYHEQRMSIEAVASKLDTTVGQIRREFEAHGIETRSTAESLTKHPSFSEMRIGESYEIELKHGVMLTFSHLYRQAKTQNLRIMIRRKDSKTAILTRTPLLTYENVLKYRMKGMTLDGIADMFGSSRRTVSRILKEKKE